MALPYPVASVLLADGDGRPFAAVPDGAARVDHGDLFDEWVVAPLAGAAIARPAGRRAARHPPRSVRGRPADRRLRRRPHRARRGTDRDVLFHTTLTAASVLGTCDRAVELAVEHVNGRIQFGKPIASFQAVQFQLADCAVAVAGLRELTHFTLWRLDAHGADALADVLALRVHAIDVARGVLRTCQQLHGAAGVCDEYDISVLTRMVQPALRLPWSAERTATELAAAIQRDGFDGLFEHGQRAGVTTFHGPPLDGHPGHRRAHDGRVPRRGRRAVRPQRGARVRRPAARRRDGAVDLRRPAARGASGSRAACSPTGVEPGQPSGILMGNRPEAVAALFGVDAGRGDGRAPVDLRAAARAGVHGRARRDRASSSPRSACWPAASATTSTRSPPTVRASAASPSSAPTTWDDVPRPTGDGIRPLEPVAAVTPDDDAVVIFSSGTTSQPKGDAALAPGRHAAVLGAGADLRAARAARACGRRSRCSGPPGSTPRWAPRSPPAGAG